MKTNVFMAIAIRVIILFAIAIVATFIPEQLREFFGDVSMNTESSIDPNWAWGARHYWYAWMCVFLFILAMVNVIIGMVNVVKKNYDTDNW